MEKHLFIAIDVSKAKLDLALRPGAESFSVAKNHRSITALIKQLKKLTVSRIVFEASGGYEIAAATELAAAGLPVGQARPVLRSLEASTRVLRHKRISQNRQSIVTLYYLLMLRR